MRTSWAPLLDNELVLEPGLTYFNVEGLSPAQEEALLLEQEKVPLLIHEETFSDPG